MSAVTAPLSSSVAPSGPVWVLRDIAVIVGRNLLKIRRSPQLLVFSTVQPIMFVLLFNYVFGGSITIPGFEGDYINYLLPGIFAQSALFGSTLSGVALNEDLRAGMVDRFRSLPMARSAVLAGRTLADAVRTTVTLLLMTAVGYVLGFRFDALLPAVGAVALAVLMAFAFAWISVNIGMRAPNAETAQVAGFIWVFPMVFASSAFAPTQAMPGWLQAFANNQPVTAVVNAVRGLANGGAVPGGGSVAGDVWAALGWVAAILAVAVPLAVRGYRRGD
jgi:ABC transporter DrrB family efflux protein